MERRHLEGQKFGRLLVVEACDKPENKRAKDYYWQCDCDCGNHPIIAEHNLLSGNTQSCGCLQKQRASEASFKDLSGQRFGKLVVVPNSNKDNGKKKILWTCKCDCGNTTEVFANNLTRMHTTSCGICVRNLTPDLTGMVFGRLTVLRKDENRKYHYICKCNCGNPNEVSIGQRSLFKNLTQSCGCLFRETTSKNNLKDITGQTFGNLTVLGRDYSRPNRPVHWLCKCSCENEAIVSVVGQNLKNGHTRSCGCIFESEIASKIKQYCKEKYDGIPEYSIFKNPETGAWLPYDAFIPKYNLFIEVQGYQHYYYNPHFHRGTQTLEYLQHKDAMKKEYAENHGYYLEIDLRKIKTVEKSILKLEKEILKIQKKEGIL